MGVGGAGAYFFSSGLEVGAVIAGLIVGFVAMEPVGFEAAALAFFSTTYVIPPALMRSFKLFSIGSSSAP